MHILEKIAFVGTHIAIIREDQVQHHLSLDDAITDLRTALEALAAKQAVNCARIRVTSRDSAWLHTLRAGLQRWRIIGGKDYTSLGFETPAMWATVIDMSTGVPLAFVEADYLSRVRTAAMTAIATDLLAPPNVTCLAHFGAGKISELLVRAVLKVRPSVRRVFLVRRNTSKGGPDWLSRLENGVEGEMVDATHALIESDIVTTATSSREPVIPANAEINRVRHINLIGSNHLKRREISEELALRFLSPGGYLVVDDQRQAELEAGDFSAIETNGALDWSRIPTLDQLLCSSEEQEKVSKATITAFKSVGIGLADLAVAAGVLQRIGLLPNLPRISESETRKK
ncbi:MAG: hypothetical protein L0229_25310 [Blastocatellia bacterium]|nr:hypothetical protein [Blastocatellia bacterium]